MCTYVRTTNKWRVTSKPITCWKVMLKKDRHGKIVLKSLMYGKKYQECGTELLASNSSLAFEYYFSDAAPLTSTAVHAFLNREDAVSETKCTSLINNLPRGTSIGIVKCVIPKGTLYIKGTSNIHYSYTDKKGIYRYFLRGEKLICAKKILTEEFEDL